MQFHLTPRALARLEGEDWPRPTAFAELEAALDLKPHEVARIWLQGAAGTP